MKTPCIELACCRNAAGYAVVRFGGQLVRAHRLSYAAANCVSLESLAGLQIRHACDNPACVNPQHLETGTHTDNMRDMMQRGRGRQPKGEGNAKAVLTDADVRQIRQMLASGMPQPKIAAQFNVHTSQISRISTGNRWSHVQ